MALRVASRTISALLVTRAKHDGTLGGALLPFSRSAASEPQPTAVPWHEHIDDDREWT